MGKKIEYTNGELTIIWQPELCQHAGICVKINPPIPVPQEGTKENKTIISEKEKKGNRRINCPNQSMSVWRVDIPNE